MKPNTDRIVIVEDDPLAAARIEDALAIKVRRVEVVRIATELEFRKKFTDLVQNPPALLVVDIMLRWTDPAPDYERPPNDVREQGYYRAGFRCVESALGSPLLALVPVVLYSVLDQVDIEDELKAMPTHIRFVNKDRGVDALVDEIRSILDSREERP